MHLQISNFTDFIFYILHSEYPECTTQRTKIY